MKLIGFGSLIGSGAKMIIRIFKIGLSVCLLLSVLFVCPFANASNDDYEYYYVAKNGVLYQVKHYFSSSYTSYAECIGFDDREGALPIIYGDVTIESSIDGYPVLSVYGFRNSSELTSVYIPDSVKSIGNWAFEGCSNLKNLRISNCVKTIQYQCFANCPNLEELVIPDSVETIEDGAFYRSLDNVERISIGSSLKSISYSSGLLFTSKRKLREITISSNNQNFSSQNGVMYNKDMTKLVLYPNMASSSFSIPDTVIYIGNFAFGYCDNLTNVAIPNSVTYLSDYCFSGCSSLTAVSIPESVTVIRRYAFEKCSNISHITIPDSVRVSEEGVFSGCSNLSSVRISKSLATISEGTFSNCGSLADIHIPSSVTTIEKSAFLGCPNVKNVFYSGTPVEWYYMNIEEYNDSVKNAQVHILTKVDGKDATCTLSGKKTYYECTCGKNVEDINHENEITGSIDTWVNIPASGHTPVTLPAVEASCTNSGLTEGSKCSVCGEVLEPQERVDKLPHTPVTLPAVEATCTNSGLTEGSKCSVCGVILEPQDQIDKLPHTPVTMPAVEATCTNSGLTEGSKCSVCNRVITSQKYVAAKGHSPETIPAVEATCTNSGLTEGSKCSVCGEVITDQKYVAAKGHTYVTVPALSPTCVSTGLSEGIACIDCGHVYEAQKVIAKTPHTPAILQRIEPTCCKTGLTEGVACEYCEYVILPQSKIDKVPHNPKVIDAVDATCTSSGLTAGSKCSFCGEVLEAQQEVAKLAHKPVSLPAVAATTDKTGLTEGSKCSVCGTILKAQQVVPKLSGDGQQANQGGQQFSNQQQAGSQGSQQGGQSGNPHAHALKTKVTPATFSKAGAATTTCASCGAVTAKRAIPKISRVRLSATSFAYDGKAKTPSVTVTDAKGRAISPVHYKVSMPVGRKAVGTYRVKVTFRGDYKGTKTLSFKINPRGTKITGMMGIPGGISVNWKPVASKMGKSRLAGYQLRYSTSSGMKGAKARTVKGCKKKSLKITGLVAGASYYVQIRTYMNVNGKAYYSKWA